MFSATEAATQREGLEWVMSHVSATEQLLLDRARARLGETSVAEATQRGRNLGRDELLEFALSLASELRTETGSGARRCLLGDRDPAIC